MEHMSGPVPFRGKIPGVCPKSTHPASSACWARASPNCRCKNSSENVRGQCYVGTSEIRHDTHANRLRNRRERRGSDWPRRGPIAPGRVAILAASRDNGMRLSEDDRLSSGDSNSREEPMKGPTWLVSAALALVVLCGPPLSARTQTDQQARASARKSGILPWKFAASGDSRNCGDVVMPAIAAAAKRSGARFYWHLGDFRKMYAEDEDLQHQPAHLATPLSLSEYQQIAWTDFIENQIEPFGALPVFLSIGNHEMVPPKTRAVFLTQFSRWLDAPDLRAQRLRDDPADLHPKTYYHWIRAGVDFVNLDNATKDQFDSAQLAWLEKTLQSDAGNPRIRSIVVGMHEALPESISFDHSMNQSETGTESGRRVYADLLRARDQGHKRVYVLASHSHYFLEGVYDTPYWREHGGVLPGWIVGTAGAERYSLPKEAASGRAAETNVYGFLLGSVRQDGAIRFAFQRVNEPDISRSVVSRYTPEFVHWCFAENSAAH